METKAWVLHCVRDDGGTGRALGNGQAFRWLVSEEGFGDDAVGFAVGAG